MYSPSQGEGRFDWLKARSRYKNVIHFISLCYWTNTAKRWEIELQIWVNHIRQLAEKNLNG
jgi:hypothetical protein